MGFLVAMKQVGEEKNFDLMEILLDCETIEIFDETENGKYGNPKNILRINIEKYKIEPEKCYILSVKEVKFYCKVIHGKSPGVSQQLEKNLDLKRNRNVKIILDAPKSIKKASKVNFTILSKVDDEIFIDQTIDIMKIIDLYITKLHYQTIHILDLKVLLQIVDIEDYDENSIYLLTEKTKFKHVKSLKQKNVSWRTQVKQDFPGYDKVVDDFIEILENSLVTIRQRVYGIILSGESGTGKSKLINSIISHSNWSSIEVDSGSIFQENLGDAEKQLNVIFQKAKKLRDNCIVIFDNFELISNPKGAERKQVLHEFLSLMRTISQVHDFYIVVIGITDDLDSVDKRLIDLDKFEKTIELKVPTEESRIEISKHILKDFKVKDEREILNFIKEKAHGYIAKDVYRLIVEGYLNAKMRNDEEITLEDIQKASVFLQPSVLSKSFFKPVKTTITLNDLAGIDDVKESLRRAILDPMKHPEKYKEIGIQPPKGVLLYGPSGTGKTVIAQAIANEAKANFVSVQCTDILSKYVGQSSKTISQIFKKARASAPCILFFDQFESIARSRGDDTSESQANDRMLSTLLIEMDGIFGKKDDNKVVVLAATNRKDLLDVSILRPGRLDQHIELKKPNQKSRVEILKLKFKEKKLEENIDLEELSKIIKGFSGSEIDHLCKESYLNSLRETPTNPIISRKHIEQAYKTIKC